MNKKPKTKFVRLKNLDIDKFLDMVDRANIKHPQVIEFNDDNVICRARPENRSYMKQVKRPVNGMFEYEKGIPEKFGKLMLPMFRFTKLIKTLKVFKMNNDDKVNAKIAYKSEDGGIHGVYIDFVSPKTKAKINAAEAYFVDVIPQDKWDKYNVIDPFMCKFKLSDSIMSRISQLCALEGNDNSEEKEKDISFVIEINPDENHIKFKSKDPGKWGIVYNEDDGFLDIKHQEQIELVAPKQIFSTITKKDHNAYIVKIGKSYVLILNEEDKDDTVIKGLPVFYVA